MRFSPIYSDRPASVEPDQVSLTENADGTVDRQYQYGLSDKLRVDFTVFGKPAEDGTPQVQARVWSRWRGGVDVKQVLPNIDFSDGQIRIGLEDLVELVLQRMAPVELAQVLWRESTEVRAAFMEAMISRYDDNTVRDSERRAFLVRVQNQVQEQRIDDLAKRLTESEWAFLQDRYYFDEVNRINQVLKHRDVRAQRWDGARMVDTDEVLQLKHFTNIAVGTIAGKEWNEVRRHWDAEMKRFFPLQEVPKVDYGEPGEPLVGSEDALATAPMINQNGDEEKPF